MALHLDLSGLFTVAPDGRGITPEDLPANAPRAAAARGLLEEQEPAWRRLHASSEHREACARRAAEILEQGVDTFLVLGIGGSALGARAMLAALAPVYQDWGAGERPRVLVLDSVDPDWLGEVLERLDPARTHANVISKSGGTIETSAQFLLVHDWLCRGLGSAEAARQRFTVTTDPESGAFRALCEAQGFASLPVPPGVGGRFSVLSPVGLLAAEVAGLDTTSLLEGAARTDSRLREAAPEEDAALLYALTHVLLLERGFPVHVHFAYGHRMRFLADWYQQLWAESLGKRLDREGRVVHTGPTPVRAVGPTDQHSQVQLYVEGPADKVFTFLKLGRFGRSLELPEPFADSPAFRHLGGRSLNELMEAERQGTEYALLEAGRPSCVLEMCRLDAFHVGQYFQFLEVATALAGHLMGIDPFDQPGVEAGKKAALALMGCSGFEELAERIRERRGERPSLVLSC